MALAYLPTSEYTLCRILNTEIYEHTFLDAEVIVHRRKRVLFFLKLKILGT